MSSYVRYDGSCRWDAVVSDVLVIDGIGVDANVVLLSVMAVMPVMSIPSLAEISRSVDRSE